MCLKVSATTNLSTKGFYVLLALLESRLILDVDNYYTSSTLFRE